MPFGADDDKSNGYNAPTFLLSACIQSFLLNVSELQIPAYWGNSQLQVPPPCHEIWETTSSALHLSWNMKKLNPPPKKKMLEI